MRTAIWYLAIMINKTSSIPVGEEFAEFGFYLFFVFIVADIFELTSKR